MRDWLTVIIVLLILGVLLDGIRRMRAHRRESLRMSRSVGREDDGLADDDDISSSEFPAGGPRVVGVRDTSDLAHVNQNLRENYVESRKTRGAPSRQSDKSALKLETPVPMLMDSVEEKAEYGSPSSKAREPALGSLDNLDGDAYEVRSTANRRESVEQEVEQDHSDDLVQSTPYQPVSNVDDPLEEQEQEQRASAKGAVEESPRAQEEAHPEPEPRPAPDEVLVIHVMARRGELFVGPPLLDAMLAQGLRFGDMDIFHRHESIDGRGKILFSVANMVVPGTFDLEAMDEFESPGISMFLSLPIASDSLEAYNLMAESAQNIAQLLGGELKDENRSVMTRQTIEHGRQRVLEYERKRRLAKA